MGVTWHSDACCHQHFFLSWHFQDGSLFLGHLGQLGYGHLGCAWFFLQKSILFAKFWLNSITCFLMKRRKALLDHLPMSMIMNTGHYPRYITMAALDSESYLSNSHYCVSFSVLIMWSDVTWSVMPLFKYMEIGKIGVVPWYFLILFTIAAAALSGQRIVSSNTIKVIVSIFSSFFCSSNVMAMQSATLFGGGHFWVVQSPLKNGFCGVSQFWFCVVGGLGLYGIHRISLQRRFQWWQVGLLLV